MELVTASEAVMHEVYIRRAMMSQPHAQFFTKTIAILTA